MSQKSGKNCLCGEQLKEGAHVCPACAVDMERAHDLLDEARPRSGTGLGGTPYDLDRIDGGYDDYDR